jgi:hypothetical protein
MKSIFILLTIIFIPTVIFSFPGKGSGTIDDPFQITNVNELQLIYSSYFILMNDIDATETSTWYVGDHDDNPDTPDEPMGFAPIFFEEGNLDGKGHIINNLYINRPKLVECGFMERCINSSVIKNLGLVNCNITGGKYVGSFSGNISYGSIIDNCFATGQVESKNEYAAGICCVFGGQVKNSFSKCIVTANRYASSFIIETKSYNNYYNCYATGKINYTEKLQPFGNNNNAVGCFWDIETTGVQDTIINDDAFGLPTSEMLKKTTFENKFWDFDNPDKIWCIDDGKDYPKLRVFGDCPLTDIVEKPLISEAIILEIYPNPFDYITEINFSLPEYSSVDMQLVNSLGIPISEIVKEINYPAGSYKINYDCSNLPSGSYFINLKAGSHRITKLVQIIK